MIAQVILDSCDGELARVRFMGSKLGMWLDNLSDDLIDNGFALAVGLGLGGPWVYVGAAAAGARALVALNIYRTVARAGTPGDVMAFRWWFEKEVVETKALYEPTAASCRWCARWAGATSTSWCSAPCVWSGCPTRCSDWPASWAGST